MDMFRPVWEKHPHAIVYATANFDPATYYRDRRSWIAEVRRGHQRILAGDGLVNMVLFDTGVVPIASYDENGAPGEIDSDRLLAIFTPSGRTPRALPAGRLRRLKR